MDSPFADGSECAKLEDRTSSNQPQGHASLKSITIGIDIAKKVFAVYVEEEAGRVVERWRLSRKKMVLWFVNRPRAVVGMKVWGKIYWRTSLRSSTMRSA